MVTYTGICAILTALTARSANSGQTPRAAIAAHSGGSRRAGTAPVAPATLPRRDGKGGVNVHVAIGRNGHRAAAEYRYRHRIIQINLPELEKADLPSRVCCDECAGGGLRTRHLPGGCIEG